MKTRQILTIIAGIAIVATTAFAVWGQTKATKLIRPKSGTVKMTPKIAVAYVEDFRKGIPDPNMFTHLIYSFVVFNDTYDRPLVKNPEKLQAMVDLKKQNPNLKVMVSIGSSQKKGFSEMTSDSKKRKAYVKGIKHLVDSLGLDGVDLDWEFPGTGKGSPISPAKEEENYVKLVKDLRKALGKDKWISYYSNSGGAYIDHKKMEPYVDYVNVSGYNLVIPKEGERLYHQSPLYASAKTGGWCVKGSIEKHMELGIPKEKILMGIPFYGRGVTPFPTYLDCRLFGKYAGDLKPVWSEEAQAPYYADKKGNLVLGFDDERSIESKFEFINANDIPGVFVWNYDSDFDDHRLGKTVQRLRR